MSSDGAPPNRRDLQNRIQAVAAERGTLERRIQRAVANTVVGQMLPPGVVKGGTAMKVRLGEDASRYTPDFDAARAKEVPLDDYLNALGDKLAEGWGGFTGTVETILPAQLEDVPEDYVMQPFNLALSYNSEHWLRSSSSWVVITVGSTEMLSYGSLTTSVRSSRRSGCPSRNHSR